MKPGPKTAYTDKLERIRAAAPLLVRQYHIIIINLLSL